MSTSHGNPSTLQALYALGAETFDSSLSITAEQFVANVEPLAPGFGRLIVEMEFGAIYNRPGLDIKTRELNHHRLLCGSGGYRSGRSQNAYPCCIASWRNTCADR